MNKKAFMDNCNGLGTTACRLICMFLLTVAFYHSASQATAEVILSEDFSDCSTGLVKKGDAGCISVANVGDNVFEGAIAVAGLHDHPLKLVKNNGAVKGRPIMNWRMPEAQGGVLKIEWDGVIDSFTPGEKYPGVEHLLCLNITGTQGRVIQAVRMAAKGGEGKGFFDLLGQKAAAGEWTTGKSYHVSFELDQDNKSCSLALDGKKVLENIPFEGGPVLGFNFRDGGGWGCFDGTFTAGIDNLKVTHVTLDEQQAGGIRKIRIACCGDSITFGVGVVAPKINSYPAVLQKLVGSGYQVRNFGVGGRTLLRKAAAYAIGPALRYRPDIVIIMLGTNDSREKTWREHGNEFISDYNDIIAEFNHLPTKPQIYLCMPTPMFPGRWELSQAVLTGKTIPAIRKVAAKNKLQLIDLHTPFLERKSNFPDTVHPNSAIAAKMAEVVAAELKKGEE